MAQALGSGQVNDVGPAQKHDIEIYDPDRGLKEIAISEAAEKHWARARNRDKLYEAVKVKLTEQRRYALWRQTVRPAHRPEKSVSTDGVLPPTDPGEQVARRWRRRLGDEKAFNNALLDAQHRCLRICEQEKIGTVRGTEGTGESERVILLARTSIGEELRRAPVNLGGRPSKTASHKAAVSPPSIADQIGSQKRGLNLKKLAEVGREQLLSAASTLWEAGKDATQSAVLKLTRALADRPPAFQDSVTAKLKEGVALTEALREGPKSVKLHKCLKLWAFA
jgi:hypothetical protein